MIALATRLVKIRPMVITMFTTFGLHERAKAELSRNFEHGEEASAQRVR